MPGWRAVERWNSGTEERRAHPSFPPLILQCPPRSSGEPSGTSGTSGTRTQGREDEVLTPITLRPRRDSGSQTPQSMVVLVDPFILVFGIGSYVTAFA